MTGTFALCLCVVALVSAVPCENFPYGLFPKPLTCTADDTTNYVLEPSSFIVGKTGATPSATFQAALSRFETFVWAKVDRVVRGTMEPHFHSPINITQPTATSVTSLWELAVMITEDNEEHKTVESLESYTLTVDSHTARITAPSSWGAMYGLETFAQLVHYDPASGQYAIRGGPIHITDAPRFPWRGLLVDTANHFLSVPVLQNLIDLLAYHRMNVMHWHIVDSYSFPMVSQQFPLLAQMGAWDADAEYSVAEVAAIVEYARVRGIRVVPELDVPGHAYSWGLAYPDVTVPCDDVAVETDIGPINIVPLDPTVDMTYTLVSGLITEMTTVFPDDYFHAGGDELQLACWNSSKRIRDWVANQGPAHNVSDMLTLQAYFETWLMNQLNDADRTGIVWEETYHTVPQSLPKGGGGVIVEVWENMTLLALALDDGYDCILANGWYLDRQVPVDDLTTWFWEDTWAMMYSLEPDEYAGAGGPDAGSILGGEANMWSEQVSDLNVLARVWPRAAAIAERLWSAKNVTDTGNAAQRLAAHRCRVATRGLAMGPIWADFCRADLPATTPPPTTDLTLTPAALAGVIIATLLGGMVVSAVFVCGYFRHTRSAQQKAAPSQDIWMSAPRPSESDQTRLLPEGYAEISVSATPKASEIVRETSARLRSVDVLRGFAVAMMIFVDQVGEAFPEIHHCPWNGIRLADFVMPLFDFIVGISIAIAFKKFGADKERRPARLPAFKKATWRFVKIFLLGLWTQGGISVTAIDLTKVRVMGILQRVAVCYYAVALMELFLPRPRTALVLPPEESDPRRFTVRPLLRIFGRYKWHWVAGALLFVIHTSLIYGYPVPPSFGEECGRGVLTPACNAAGYIDSKIFSAAHMYFPTNGGSDGNDVTFQRLPECSSCSPGKCTPPMDAPLWCHEAPFDPEGIVSSFNAILSTVQGVHYGHVLVHVSSPAQRLWHWVPFSLVQIVLGLVIHFAGAPMNTDLYSIAYTLVTGGTAGVLLSFCYWSVDMKAWRRVRYLWLPFMWLGLNAITMYLFAEGGIIQDILGWVYWDDSDNSLANIVFPTGVFWGPGDQLPGEPTHSPAIMFWTLGYIAVTILIAWQMDRRKIYISL